MAGLGLYAYPAVAGGTAVHSLRNSPRGGLSAHITKTRILNRTLHSVVPSFSSSLTWDQMPPPPGKALALNAGRDLITGDALLLTSFCIYKQLAAIVLSPSFPGWLAPLEFSATRCTELVGFMITVVGTWVACGMLNGDYVRPAANMQQALQHTCRTWLTSTPVMGAQLVLATAAESGSLVLDDRFTLALPLAASGVGEPFASAAGILGGMLLWRTFYTGFLDWSFFLSYDASYSPRDETEAWSETVAIMGVLVVLFASAAALAGYTLNGGSFSGMSLIRIF